MDPITHLTSGLLAGQALRDRISPGKWILGFCAVAANLPDIDNLATLLGPEAYLRLHRGFTHSLIGAPLFALLLAFIFKAFKRDLPVWKTTAAGTACILLHIFLDCITSYGTQIYQPFQDTRVAWNAVFIIDPIYTLSLLGLAVFSFALPSRRHYFALIGIAWLLAYPVTSMTVRDTVASAWHKGLKEAGKSFERVVVHPDAFAPLFWKVIVVDGGEYRLTGVNLLEPGKAYPIRRFSRANGHTLREIGKKAPIFETYAWFASFPVKRPENANNGEKAMTFFDLKFVSANPLLEGRLGNGGYPPFALTVYENDDSEPVRYVYHRRGQALVYELAD